VRCCSAAARSSEASFIRSVALATRHAIPTIYELRDYVEAGGLISDVVVASVQQHSIPADVQD
jgi:hypothetical protein